LGIFFLLFSGDNQLATLLFIYLFVCNILYPFAALNIQGVSEIGTLILTGNRTRQKEQLFYLPFCRKTMFNSKKKLVSLLFNHKDIKKSVLDEKSNYQDLSYVFAFKFLNQSLIRL
jgi:hypothetical protein